jgi:hypothetical protein
MLDMTDPESYKFLIEKHDKYGISYPQLVHAYNLGITPECLRFRLRTFRNTGEIKIAKRSEDITREQLQGWVDRELTISQVFLETNIPHNFIYSACAKYKLKLRDGRKREYNRKQDLKKIEWMVNEGYDAKEIGRAVGLSYQRAKDYVNMFTQREPSKPDVNFNTLRTSVITQRWACTT